MAVTLFRALVVVVAALPAISWAAAPATARDASNAAGAARRANFMGFLLRRGASELLLRVPVIVPNAQSRKRAHDALQHQRIGNDCMQHPRANRGGDRLLRDARLHRGRQRSLGERAIAAGGA